MRSFLFKTFKKWHFIEKLLLQRKNRIILVYLRKTFPHPQVWPFFRPQFQPSSASRVFCPNCFLLERKLQKVKVSRVLLLFGLKNKRKSLIFNPILLIYIAIIPKTFHSKQFFFIEKNYYKTFSESYYLPLVNV